MESEIPFCIQELINLAISKLSGTESVAVTRPSRRWQPSLEMDSVVFVYRIGHFQTVPGKMVDACLVCFR